MNKYDESNQRQSITRGLLVVIVSTATALSIGVLIGLSSNLSLNLVVSLSVAFGGIVGLWAALKGKFVSAFGKSTSELSGSSLVSMPAPLSVIIPALNAEASLPGCLSALIPALEANLLREVIVVDGGSEDATRRLAEGSGATVLTSERGRAKQLIAGAEAARGDWLLFLHADTWLSRDWVERTLAHTWSKILTKAAVFTLAFRTDRAAWARSLRAAQTGGHAYARPALW